MNEKLRKLALTFVNYPVDPFAYKWVEIHFGLHPDFDADHVLFDEVHDFVRNLTDWNWPENQLEVDEDKLREWWGEEVHFPESRFAWWDGIRIPIPIGYSPDQLNEVWEYLTPLLEFVDTEYWGLRPKILWEGCRYAGVYSSLFWEDFDGYVSKAHMNEFAIFLLERFGSLDALKQYLEAE